MNGSNNPAVLLYELKCTYNIQVILNTIECMESNPNYELYHSSLLGLIDKHKDRIKPQAYVARGKCCEYLPTSSISGIYCMVTLGPDIDLIIQDYFMNHDYLDGLMVSAWADQVLYEATIHLYKILTKDTKTEGYYLTKRYHPGHKDVPLTFQSDIFHMMEKAYTMDSYVTEGHMISSSKSLTYFYGVGTEDSSHGLDHDCKACNLSDCDYRKFILRIYDKSSEHNGACKVHKPIKVIQAQKHENLLEVLRRESVLIDTPCGGNQICGKCRIHAPGHKYELTNEEKAFLDNDMIERGILLACFHKVDRNLDIYINSQEYEKADEIAHEQEHKIISDYIPFRVKTPKLVSEYNHIADLANTANSILSNMPTSCQKDEASVLGVAVDMGTTTVVVSLVNIVSGQVLGLRKSLNPQKAYGADIISRILYVRENQNHELGQMIRTLIEKMTLELLEDYSKETEIKKETKIEIKSRIEEVSHIVDTDIKEVALTTKNGKYNINEMVISGNTTMVYLLLDINPEELAVCPFTTIDMGLEVRYGKSLFAELSEAHGDFKVSILPWVSAYVGGDIVSGLYATNILDQEETIMFVDLGTNGEIVLKTKGQLICAATAAGPAFEGANIRCGRGSISGSICEIEATDNAYGIQVLTDSGTSYLLTDKLAGEATNRATDKSAGEAIDRGTDQALDGKLGSFKPLGICGSGLIDIIAILHRQGYINDAGYMKEAVTITQDISIYPEDVRQVQLAKAAIMAGLDVLLDEAALTYDDIDKFYIAGGFGNHLNLENSSYIGLIPEGIEDKVTLVGNTSLGGATRFLLEETGDLEIMTIKDNCQYIELSTNMKFTELYIMGMGFGGKI